MEEWKKRVDERMEAESKARYEKTLRKHKAKYSCAVCGKISSKFSGYDSDTFPTDLDRCRGCNRLMCSDHLHHYMCESCQTGPLAGKNYEERKQHFANMRVICVVVVGILLLFKGGWFIALGGLAFLLAFAMWA